VFFCFDCDRYFRSGLQGYGLAILVLERIFDANLFVEMIPPSTAISLYRALLEQRLE
jgi:hypothetical protein